jgi:putative iron-regulated protein
MIMITLAVLLLSFRASPALAESPPVGGPAMKSAIAGYAALARREYGQALVAAESLRDSVQSFLAAPSPATLATARRAWILSRDLYGRTEVFRFAGGPIDDVHPVTGVQGPENRLNAWPVDEAFLDYVAGSPAGGLIGNRSVPITAVTLVGRHGTEGEAEVTLGFHAIEFLLWGQDRNPDGPGDRTDRDYLPGDEIRDRRRTCLALELDLLVQDLAWVAREWEPGPDRYASAFIALPPAAALDRALSGVATLAGFELAAERIGIPLASGGQEDEQSCFSDTTDRDLRANVAGIALVLEGEGATPGLLSAISALDDVRARDLRQRLQRVQDLVLGVEPPFDRLLSAPEDDPRRARLQALAGELLGLAGAICRAGELAGVKVVIGGGG